MRVSSFFVPTRKEVPNEAVIPSHQYMLRAGLIRQHVAGVYTILPMGWRILRKIMGIIREEMEAIGCQEFHLPVLSPADLWRTSGRWETFGDDMFRLKDRKGRDLCLSPTHEEVFAEIAAFDIRSYRDLPQMWYQIQTKFRDEVRPRSGLIRVRQFFMKDAYSFDTTPAGLDRNYQLQREAYRSIFARCGLDTTIVKASSGAMGGRDCEEFMVLSSSGDDQVVHCASCGYSANQEVAESVVEKVSGTPGKPEKVHTPAKRTIGEVSAFLDVHPSHLVKSLVYVTENDRPVFVLVRGDHEVDEGKLAAVLGECRPAEPHEVKDLTGADIGFVSPVGVQGEVIADPVLEGAEGLVTGANENDYHYTGVSMARDITVGRYIPLKAVESGETCSQCGGELAVERGIEVGHIFKLGTRYSEALNARFLDDGGESHPIIMGSYGIGVERIMACAVEKNYDGRSMLWPRSIAPFFVEVLPLNMSSEPVRETAEKLYAYLLDHGIEVLLDDRDDRAGVKFKDGDLFGAPLQVVIGDRTLQEGKVELRIRDRDISETVPIGEIGERIVHEKEM